MEPGQATDIDDNAKVKIPPPLCFATFLIGGILVQSDWISGSIGPIERLLAGGAILASGLFVLVKEARSHKKSGSNVEPWKPTTLILSSGFYAYSRNPIYVGMAIAYIGIAIAAGSIAAIAALPLSLLIIRYHVIAREEAYLEGKFGDEYLAYKQKVRRWI